MLLDPHRLSKNRNFLPTLKHWEAVHENLERWLPLQRTHCSSTGGTFVGSRRRQLCSWFGAHTLAARDRGRVSLGFLNVSTLLSLKNLTQAPACLAVLGEEL